jgi:hypothetical protein
MSLYLKMPYSTFIPPNPIMASRKTGGRMYLKVGKILFMEKKKKKISSASN